MISCSECLIMMKLYISCMILVLNDLKFEIQSLSWKNNSFWLFNMHLNIDVFISKLKKNFCWLLYTTVISFFRVLLIFLISFHCFCSMLRSCVWWLLIKFSVFNRMRDVSSNLFSLSYLLMTFWKWLSDLLLLFLRNYMRALLYFWCCWIWLLVCVDAIVIVLLSVFLNVLSFRNCILWCHNYLSLISLSMFCSCQKNISDIISSFSDW